jgi:hypothetical protein
MKKKLAIRFPSKIVLFLILLSFNLCLAQTNPVAQTLPYIQNFSTLLATSAVYPAGWIGWNLSSTGPTSSFPLIAPPAASDLNLNGSSTASTTTLGVHNYNGKIGILPGATANPTLVLAINTTGRANVLVGFDIMTIRNPFDVSNTRINQVDLQYRVGTTGNFASVTNISAGVYQNNTTNQTTSVTTPQNSQAKSFTLPTACNNQPIVQLRWVIRDVSGVNNRPSFAIDNVSICPTTTTPTITIIGPSGSCVGNNAIYAAAITNGGTLPNYQWKKNGINIGNNSSVFSTSGLAIGDQIQCVLTSNASCVTTNIVSSNTITILSVSNAPSIVLQSISNESCLNAKNGAINISISGGTPPYTIAWDTINIQNGANFGVTFGTKTSSHPLFGQGNPNGYIIDGVEAKVLNLTRGINYSFNVLAPTHPFFIASNITGGNLNFIVTNGQTGAPTQNGTVTFTPNQTHPSVLYYPCQFHPFMGYIININNGYLTEDLTGLASGIYSVIVTDANGCTASNVFNVSAGTAPCELNLNLKSYMQGLYQSGGSIIPRLYNLGLSNDATACDSIIVELRSNIDYSLIASSGAILHIDGTSIIPFPPTVLGNSYYIVVRHSNAIETWSKNAIPFLVSPVSFDFTTP